MSATITLPQATSQPLATVKAFQTKKTAGKKRALPHEEMAPDRASKKRQRTDANDENGKKQRGRPRVEGEDETAADV